MSAEEIPSLGGTAGHQTARHNCRKTFRSCGVISLGDIIEYNSPLHDSHARHRSFCRSSAEAIGTHHGVLEISTIDASNCQARVAFSLSQVTEGFADEQSSAALTEHTPLLFIGTYEKRLAITASSTRVHRESQAGEACP